MFVYFCVVPTLYKIYKNGDGKKMEQEPKEKGYIEDREKVITEVELIENKFNSQQIDKLIFAAKDGNITWKPKHTTHSYEGGIKVTKTVPMEKDLIPELVTKIALESNEKGAVKVIVAYSYMVVEKDGKDVTYRFLNSEKTLDNWQIIPEEVTTERVGDKP